MPGRNRDSGIRKFVGDLPAALSLTCMVWAVGPIAAHAAGASDPCSSLAAVSVPNVTITSATPITAPLTIGSLTVPPPFCRVVAVAKPGAASHINFEVWLPPAGMWNGKFRGEGSGGSAGAIGYAAMADGLRRSYATMANDNGHTGSSWTFASSPDAVIDFGYRAQHSTTVAAKQIVASYYGSAPKHSYFVGCSQGGHHAQMEVQRYPDDYDGVVGGSTAAYWTRLMTFEVWVALSSTAKVPPTPMPQMTLNAAAAAVTKQCNNTDGLSEPYVANPQICHWNPASLQCPAGSPSLSCLTANQVTAFKNIYNGTVQPTTHEKLAPGLMRGSEAAWLSVLVGASHPGGSSYSFFRDGVYMDPNYDFQNFKFDTSYETANNKTSNGETWEHILNATSPDIEAFRARGGKLIMTHGWADPFIPSGYSVLLYNSFVADQAARGRDITQVDDFVRLFMVPGMGHCAGGPGANVFNGAGAGGAPMDKDHDVVVALENWVEKGVAPDHIIATKFQGDNPANPVAFTRKLCVYPDIAKYTGSGDPNDGNNFDCVTPMAGP